MKKNELQKLLLILKDKKKFNESVYEEYKDALTSFDDLLGDGYKDMSSLFYLVNRHFLYMLDNDPEIAIKEKDIKFRRKFHEILKRVGPGMLGCTQVIENKNHILNPNEENVKDNYLPELDDEPVIYVSNHGFRDDALATVLAANRHAYIYWGSLPLFYNTFDGFASSLVGEVVMNRKVKESRATSLAKCNRVMDLGADLIIYPEAGWNKTIELLMLNLWKGVYTLSKERHCKVVPIAHYVRDLEVVDKKNIIHTIVDEPIALYEMEEQAALNYLRDTIATWQWRMAELYGVSTRKEELKEFNSSDEVWHDHLNKRMSGVDRYDSSVEKCSDYRPKNIVRSEDVFMPIANIEDITPENAKMVVEARKLVKENKSRDYQRLY